MPRERRKTTNAAMGAETAITSLPAYLDRALSQRGWNRAELARRTVIDGESMRESSLGHIFNNRSQVPKLETLHALALALSPDDPGTELQRLVRMCGFPMEADAPPGQELAYLLALDPALRVMVDDLASLSDSELLAVRSFLAGLRKKVPRRAHSWW